MNIVLFSVSKQPFRNIEILYNILRKRAGILPCYYTTTVDIIDEFATELITKRKNTNYIRDVTSKDKTFLQYPINDAKSCNIPYTKKMSAEEFDELFLENLSKNNEKQLKSLISLGCEMSRLPSETVLIKLFRAYSIVGKTDIVMLLQDYCKLKPDMYEKHGSFQHYLARAQCMKGNSEIGLSLLKASYGKHVHLRSLYRCIFRELIQDSVLNRSEASLVAFKKHVIEFSENWNDHYPLICLWHICWSSTWFSDQMLANELLEDSITLRNIIKDKATVFSITILHRDYNEDAITRMLQFLLKYSMMSEYAKVLQVLFNYKLRNRDIRGCSEIIKNCETLGVTLASQQQDQYIHMLIKGDFMIKPSSKMMQKTFKLKF